MNRRRFLIAALISPLLVPLVLLTFGAVISGGDPEYLPMLTMALLFATPFAYLGALFFGAPALWYLQRTRQLNAVNLILAGAAAGTLVVAAGILCFEALIDTVAPFSLWQAAYGAGFGAGVATMFAWITGIRR